MMKTLSRWLWGYIHQSWLVVWCCGGMVAGTIIGLILRVKFFVFAVWWLPIGLLLVVIYLVPRRMMVMVAVMVGLGLGFCRVAAELHGEDYIGQMYGMNVLVTGVVDGDPDFDLGVVNTRLKNLQFGEGKVAAKGSIYVSIKYNGEIKRGDTVTLDGRLSEGFGTYTGYMYRPKLIAVLRPEQADLTMVVRDWFAARIRKLIPEPEANLGLSYLLGMKSGLTDEMNEKLRIVGLIHIVVASGAHLSILVGVARKVFGKLSRFAGLFFSICFIVFFMMMIGFTPSILRAGLMSILTLVTWYVGRKVAAWRMILMIMAVTLMMNPMFVMDLGWLLSFASYAGITILGPRMVKFFYGEMKPGFVGGIIMTTMAATAMTLPLTLYFYGMTSMVSLVANLLILPTLPYAMGLVFVTGVVTGMPGVENLVAMVATKMLSFHIVVVNFLSGMKSLIIEIPTGQAWVLATYGLVVGFLIWSVVKEKRCSKYKDGSILHN